MTIKLQGWASDFTVQLPGRKPMTALMTFASDDGSDPWEQMNHPAFAPPYTKVEAICHSSPSSMAFVRGVQYRGPGTIEVTLENVAGQKWTPGVHLFTIAMFEKDHAVGSSWTASTFCSVVVPGAEPSKKPTLTKTKQFGIDPGAVKLSKRKTSAT